MGRRILWQCGRQLYDRHLRPAALALPPRAHTAVYLDFTGWSGNLYGSQQTFAPYDTDGNPATFSVTEQQDIVEGWRRVAEYLAPFQIDVTTSQPTNASPSYNNYCWDVITPSVVNAYSYCCWATGTPNAFIEQDYLLASTSAVLHETGHNSGMAHQATFDSLGNKAAEYRGPLDPLHGVLMGLDFDGTPAKLIEGHPDYSPTVVQDDLALLAAKAMAGDGGDGYRAEPSNVSFATATPLALGTPSYGIIERLTDADYFSFAADGAGSYQIDVTPDSPSMLDAKLQVFDSNDQFVTSVTIPTASRRT